MVGVCGGAGGGGWRSGGHGLWAFAEKRNPAIFPVHPRCQCGSLQLTKAQDNDLRIVMGERIEKDV